MGKNYDQVKLPVNRNKQHYILYENQPPKKALLLFVEDTIDVLEKQIKSKRITVPPPQNQETATELSDTEIDESSAKNKTTSNVDINPVVNQQLEQLKAKLAFDSSLSIEMKQQKSRRINKQYLFKDYNPYQVSRATRSRHKNKIKQLYEKNLFSGENSPQNIFDANNTDFPITEPLVSNTTKLLQSSISSTSVVSLEQHQHPMEENSTMDFSTSLVDSHCISKETQIDCSDPHQQQSTHNQCDVSSRYLENGNTLYDKLSSESNFSNDKPYSDSDSDSDSEVTSDSDSDSDNEETSDSESEVDSEQDSEYEQTTESDSDNSSTDDSFRFNCDKMNGSTIMFPQSSSTVSDVLLMVTAFSVSKHLTRNDQDDLINLIKVLAGSAFESWNASHYSRSKAYNPPRKKIQSNFYCQTEKCQRILHTRKLSDKDKKIKVQCSDCKAKYKLSSASKNQFIIIDLKYQLKLLFRDTEVKNDLLNTMEKLRQPRNDGVINDIYDSQLYKAVQKLSPGALTYNVNTDGAPLTKSSKRSMWPIQLHINELSPTLRFRNVLLGGLYITSAEPSPEFMQTYMSKFLEKANNIMEADSVARPVIQNRFQFNGYLGCSWCYATGVYDSSAMRYPITQQDPLLRTNQSHIKDVEQVEKLGKSINGVKGNCAMLELKHFDCVWGFPLDYMHGILLGVSRHLWALWTKPGTPYYLNPQQRKKDHGSSITH
ncbi:uncharacterized protein LOC141533894 [Cotesia typhae]|uniref:uncharacterized protein LOC141533894 n=1 Tax=Cotesia typhae TaxID=2053667 RepID=UPI003D698458